jgi:hypothetical protein
MENNFIKIKYLNNNVKILKYLSESNKIFNKKIEFIKKLEKYNIKWKKAIKITNLWEAIKYQKCKYNNKIDNNILEYDN